AYTLPIVEKKPAPKPAPILNPWPGWLAAALITILAYAIHYLPFAPFRVEGPAGVRRPVSAAILAIFAGALAASPPPISQNTLRRRNPPRRPSLPLTIVLPGASLSFSNATAVGLRACVVIVGTMAAALVSAWLFGKMFGLWPRTSVLIGAGTAICGNSA